MVRPRWMRPSWAVMVNLLPESEAVATPVVRAVASLAQAVDGCSLTHDSRIDH